MHATVDQGISVVTRMNWHSRSPTSRTLVDPDSRISIDDRFVREKWACGGGAAGRWVMSENPPKYDLAELTVVKCTYYIHHDVLYAGTISYERFNI